jgi:hypothetical protein
MYNNAKDMKTEIDTTLHPPLSPLSLNWKTITRKTQITKVSGIHFTEISNCARKSTSPTPPGGHFSLANYSPNFSQKFDQKLASTPERHFSLDLYENNIASPTRRAFLTRKLFTKLFTKV